MSSDNLVCVYDGSGCPVNKLGCVKSENAFEKFLVKALTYHLTETSKDSAYIRNI